MSSCSARWLLLGDGEAPPAPPIPPCRRHAGAKAVGRRSRSSEEAAGGRPLGKWRRAARGRHPALAAAAAFLAQLLCHGHTGRLYSSQEPVNILEADGVKDLLGNWSGAWVVEFYWSWGGPCVNYGATWKVLGPGGERATRSIPSTLQVTSPTSCTTST
ncbi:sulfhydryl oxidase 1-like [Hemiscyllium ocellatum]|uniref:sulfhydryl oxidase 1-like n=1 Tax=Hemiscyllium ocellatum TaxID=170820 RepID=UPI0029671F51|nr:sulfhydryl oxidase 1-like [Hemiscyllium ocellatum]XP_060678594.1 sulfhydryl oxidase 1-like [Hemiscyllium ocellatum]